VRFAQRRLWPALLLACALASEPGRAADPPPVPEGAAEGDFVEVDGVYYEVVDGALAPLPEDEESGEDEWLDDEEGEWGEEDDEWVEDETSGEAELVVSGSRVDRGGKPAAGVDVLDKDFIAETGARNVADVLERAPGLTVTDSTGTGKEVSIDGLDAKHVLVLVDGRPLNGRVRDKVDLSRLAVSVSEIEKVEVVRGPTSALYGSEALGGVINIVTKKPRPGARADVEVGGRITRFGLVRQAVSGSGSVGFGDVVLRGHANATFDDAVDRGGRDDESGVITDRPDSIVDVPAQRQGTLGLELGWFLSDDWVLRSKFGLSWNEVETRVQRATLRRHTSDGQVNLGVHLGGDFLERHSLEVDLYVDRYVHRYERLADGGELHPPTFCAPAAMSWRFFDGPCPAEPQLLTDSTQDQARLETIYTVDLSDLPWWNELRLSTGGVVRGDLWQRLNGDGEDTIPGGGQRLTASLFGEVLYRPFSFWSIVPGLRLDGILPGAGDDPVAGTVGPKVSTRLDLPFDLSLRGSYGQGYRVATFQELYLQFDHSDLGYVVEGNPELVPETSYGGRGEVIWSPFGGAAQLGAELYTNLVSQLIQEIPVGVDPDTLAVVYTYRNVARAVTSGLNLRLSIAEVNGVSFSLGYQYLFGAVDATACPEENPWFCSEEDGAEELLGRSPHSGNARVGYRLAATDTTFFARTDFLDERIVCLGIGCRERTKVSGYVRLGAGIRQDLFGYGELLLAFDNLLDTYDPRYGPKPGRHVTFSLRGSL
jgi:outer membrane receptor for ferrienterochelin and colicins